LPLGEREGSERVLGTAMLISSASVRCSLREEIGSTLAMSQKHSCSGDLKPACAWYSGNKCQQHMYDERIIRSIDKAHPFVCCKPKHNAAFRPSTLIHFQQIPIITQYIMWYYILVLGRRLPPFVNVRGCVCMCRSVSLYVKRFSSYVYA
jgi:hypothetical protein